MIPQEKRIGLALSGGGFRATLYHLGLLRFLFDAGILPNVSHITSVSGGSIIAAHLCLNWDRYTRSAEEFDAAAAELLTFVRLDVRNRILRRFPLALPLRPLRRLVGRANRKLTRTGLLEYHYEKFLYGDRSLFELPERPQLHILATNLSEGRLSSFNRDGLWQIRRDLERGFRIDRVRISLATVAMAVAASSAFPGFFPPMFLTEEDVGATSGAFGRQTYTDGGVFDNLGVRMFHFLAKSAAPDERLWDGVLVSDVGKPFTVQSDARSSGLVRTAMRASDILMDRVWQLESETFRDAAGYVFARISDVVDPKDDPTALHPEIQRRLPSVRTDLDRFSPLEICSLIRHGYCIGRKVCRTLPSAFGTQLPLTPPWTPALETDVAPAAIEPAAGTDSARRVPTDATREARTLHASAVRRIWSSLVDYRDWTTYIYAPIILPILVLAPYFSVEYYERSHRLGQIISSLAQGSRDVEQMARLLQGPVERFAGERAEELPSGAAPGTSGFTIMQDLRMVDLRSWRAGAGDDPGSYVYGYRRLKVRRDSANVLNHDFRFSVLSVAVDTRVRFPTQRLKPKVYWRSTEISPDGGEMLRNWEVGVDFRTIPSDEPTEIIYEHISPGNFLREGVGSVTMPFEVNTDTLELTRWLLMPHGKRYRNFQLLRYPKGRTDQPENVRLTTEYLPEDRTILAFKLLGVDPGYTYELTWFYQ